MIHYDLRCEAGHGFDGWYKDSAAFDRLIARRLVECPVCASTSVTRALMAPAIATRRRGAAEPEVESKSVVPSAPAVPSAAPAPPAGPAPGAPPHLPDQMRALLQRMRTAVEQNCDYVGPDFAREARRIHEGEAEPRGIYGEATEAEAEALAEDGIDVSRIPWLPRAEG